MGDSVGDEVAAVRSCLSVIISQGKDRIEEAGVDFAVKGISFEEIVGAANKDGHSWGIFESLREEESKTDANQYNLH